MMQIKKKNHLYLAFLLLPLLGIHPVYAENTDLVFQKLFQQWTHAFNKKDLHGTCSLFSKNVIADYQGVPQKNYSILCDGFKKVFQEKKLYRYTFKLHQVYRSENLAAVRITWYLSIYDAKKLISTTQDEGIDIFKKNLQGQWEIINYIGYEVK